MHICILSILVEANRYIHAISQITHSTLVTPKWKILSLLYLMPQIVQDHHCWTYAGHIHLELLKYDYTSPLQNKTQIIALIYKNLTYKKQI